MTNVVATAPGRLHTLVDEGRAPSRGVLDRLPAIKAHLVVMSVIFAGALFVGYSVLPGVNERIAALERDGKNKEALRLLEQSFEGGDRSQRTLYQLQRLYEHFGELDQARKTLELLADSRPRDQQVQRQLAQFYKLTQNEEGYIAAMRRQLAIRYSEPVCKSLIGTFRRAGDYAAEQAMITECRSKGYRRPDDVIRLAYLVAVDGNIAEASSLLRSVDDRRRLRVDRDRLMLFTTLLEAGQAEEAQKRALRWLKGSRDDALVLLLIDNLANENRHDLAIDLARDVGTPGDSVSLAVAELMISRDQAIAARAYLKGWLDAARIRDAGLAQRFVSAALGAEDPELAYRGAELFGLKRMAQSDLMLLAEALSAVGQTQMFQSVREAIEPETLKDNPLLAAAIEADKGAREPARQLLSQVQVDGLDEWRLALWARLMETTGRAAGGTNPPIIGQIPTRFDRRFKGPTKGRYQPQNAARRRPQPPSAGPAGAAQPPAAAFPKALPSGGG